MSEESQDSEKPVEEEQLEEEEQVEEEQDEPPEPPLPEPVKSGRSKLSEDEKKARRRETQKTYYQKIRDRASVPAASPAAPPAPVAPPVAPVAKPALKRQKKAEAPRVHYEPTSPRTTMINAWREAKIHQSTRRQQMYESWLQ